MAGVRWTKEEILILEEMIGSDEVDRVIDRFRSLAKKNNWPDRTKEAVLIRIKRSGKSRRPIDDGWNCTTLAEALQCDRDRVHDWIDRGLLKSTRRKGKRHHRITRRHFAEFAEQYPEWLTDIDLEYLQWLVSSETLEIIRSLPPRTRGVRFMVKSSKTGKTYQSMRQAEKAEFFTRSSIARVVKGKGNTRDGVVFELVKRGNN